VTERVISLVGVLAKGNFVVVARVAQPSLGRRITRPPAPQAGQPTHQPAARSGQKQEQDQKMRAKARKRELPRNNLQKEGKRVVPQEPFPYTDYLKESYTHLPRRATIGLFRAIWHPACSKRQTFLSDESARLPAPARLMLLLIRASSVRLHCWVTFVFVSTALVLRLAL
jgi:hypothetical protein